MEKEIGWLLQEKYKGKKTAAFKKDIERLKAGEPLDHIIGFVEFLGCKILVGPEVLIPRPETELMAEQAINEVHKVSKVRKVFKVLDMFAGSGCIGLAVLKHIKNAHVTFVDSEKGAVEQIKKNCRLNKISAKRYEIIQSDVFDSSYKLQDTRFHIIFANPPYIPTTKKSKLQKSVLDYEPHAALFGGSDGLLFIKRFLKRAKDFLGVEGRIYMEFDSPQKSAIIQILKRYKYGNWDFHRDQYGKVRYVVVQ